jgi:DNA invertase Pin-like site-specific DNA recombinase
VITMVMYAKVRRMFFREHVSISEIGRRTSLSRNTIKKWLRAPGRYRAHVLQSQSHRQADANSRGASSYPD